MREQIHTTDEQSSGESQSYTAGYGTRDVKNSTTTREILGRGTVS